jgi:hypothetical protein
MKSMRFALFRHTTTSCAGAAIMFALLVASFAPATATAQTSVFVPGNAGGCFGNNPGGGNYQCVPFVPALTVSGPGTITITYVSGIVTWTPCCTTGPLGVTCSASGPPTGCGLSQTPLSESRGTQPKKTIIKIGALIGAFVPQARAQAEGFQPLDGSKNVAPVGIMPGTVFFIGTGRTITVTEAGTLFLGINDWYVPDNSGGFNVTVTGS